MLLLIYNIISKLISYPHYFMKPTEANSHKSHPEEWLLSILSYEEDVNKIFWV